MPLIDYIHLDNLEKTIFISEKRLWTAQDILDYKNKHSAYLQKIKNKNIALDFKNPLSLAIWLILLDGIATTILIVPPCMEDNIKYDFFESTASNIVFSDYNGEMPDIDRQNVNNLPATNDMQPTPIEHDIKTEWILTTSGTTGSPKLVKHNLKSLTNTVKQQTKAVSYIWGLLYGLNRYAGIQVFLQSFIGCAPLALNEEEQDITQKIDFLLSQNVNCLSATPTLWRKILMLPNAHKLNLKTITLGGEIADQQILQALAAQFPTAKIRHIYASTEAGVGFAVGDGMAGFPLSYLNSGLNDVQLKIGSNETLLIQSKSQSNGYAGNNILSMDSGFIDTGDKIKIIDNRCYFDGRESGSINVGGNKVQPEYIERILMNYPGVLIARVSPRKNSIMGNLVQANLVLSSPQENTKDFITKIKVYCRQEMDAFMVPAFINIVEDIELNNTGKIERK